MQPHVHLAAHGDTGANPVELFLPAGYDILWSAVVMAALLIFFGVFAVPRFRRILDDRAAAIEGGIEKAEKAQAEAAAALEQYNRQLAEGRAEAAAIREQARTEGAQILAELKEKASQEADRIVANAHQQIEADRQAAVVALRAEVGTLALDLASGVIGEQLADDAKSQALVDRMLVELEADQKAVK